MDNDRLPGLPGNEYLGSQPDFIIYDEAGLTPQQVAAEQRMLNYIERTLSESVSDFIGTTPTEGLMVAIRNGYNSLINSGDIVDITAEQNPNDENVLDVTIQTRAPADAPIQITLHTSSIDKILEKVNAVPRIYNKFKDIHWGMWYHDEVNQSLRATASWQCKCGFRIEQGMISDIFFVQDDIVIKNAIESRYRACIEFFNRFEHNHSEYASSDTDMLDHVVL